VEILACDLGPENGVLEYWKDGDDYYLEYGDFMHPKIYYDTYEKARNSCIQKLKNCLENWEDKEPIDPKIIIKIIKEKLDKYTMEE